MQTAYALSFKKECVQVVDFNWLWQPPKISTIKRSFRKQLNLVWTIRWTGWNIWSIWCIDVALEGDLLFLALCLLWRLGLDRVGGGLVGGVGLGCFSPVVSYFLFHLAQNFINSNPFTHLRDVLARDIYFFLTYMSNFGAIASYILSLALILLLTYVFTYLLVM